MCEPRALKWQEGTNLVLRMIAARNELRRRSYSQDPVNEPQEPVLPAYSPRDEPVKPVYAVR